MSDAMAGDNFNSLEDLDGAYKRAEEAAKRYLSVTKQDYELNKLRRNILQ
jgi:hypothetical protein